MVLPSADARTRDHRRRDRRARRRPPAAAAAKTPTVAACRSCGKRVARSAAARRRRPEGVARSTRSAGRRSRASRPARRRWPRCCGRRRARLACATSASCARRARDAGQPLRALDRHRGATADATAGSTRSAAASGTAGAADPGGPFGTGKRLRAGDRVLWFWCAQGVAGCQRTLEVTPGAVTGAERGGTWRVTVRGYDDQGTGKAVAGARRDARRPAGDDRRAAAGDRSSHRSAARGSGCSPPRPGWPTRSRREVTVA